MKKSFRAGAVICEFNPLHAGHEYLIEQIKSKCDTAICVMSGSFVQRGNTAIMHPYARAEAAVRAGADVVLELPFPWCASSAESFAAAGVDIACRAKADALFFGSESADIDKLTSAAKATLDPRFAPLYSSLAPKLGAASAYAAAVTEIAKLDGEIAANDLLGIAYLRAILKSGAPITPQVIRRLGSGYNDTEISGNEYPSATALRELIFAAHEDEYALSQILDGMMPRDSVRLLIDGVRDGTVPTDMTRLDAFFHAYYRLQNADGLEGFAELSGGLADRICRMARECETPQKFTDALGNKHHTDARIRRALLFGATGVTENDVRRSTPSFTTLLAASKNGCEYLKSIKRSRDIEMITKPADAPDCRQTRLSDAANALYTLAIPTPRAAGYFNTLTPYIEK